MRRQVLTYVLLICCAVVHAESLPAVYITAEGLSETFTEGTVQVADGEPLLAEIRYRGATALRYQKKSFAIKFKDTEGAKLNVSLLDMRSDNSWILDAMAMDKARMRNRVSTDLWLDFSHSLSYAADEPKAVNGTHGQFVEVYLNNEYIGLYCLTEKVDRKQLKLKKYNETEGIRGVLYKASRYCSMWKSDDSFYVWDNNQPTWDNGSWELQYPDFDDGEPIDWKPLADIIRWLNSATDEKVKDSLALVVDLPVWIDYFLLVDLMLGNDNAAKNMFVSYYNIKQSGGLLAVTPWDMDATWGRDYTAAPAAATSETELYHQIHSRLLYAMDALQDIYEPRYAELRTTFFSAESLKSYFLRYFTLFRTSGAGIRETDRWNGVDGITLDFDSEEQYICNWIDQRLAVLDEKYNYTEDVTSLSELCSMTQPEVTYPVYTMSGQFVGSVCAPTLQQLQTLRPARGVYIIDNKKFLVR